MPSSLRPALIRWLYLGLTATGLASLAPTKLAAQTRIACLGDSNTFSNHLRNWCDQLVARIGVPFDTLLNQVGNTSSRKPMCGIVHGGIA